MGIYLFNAKIERRTTSIILKSKKKKMDAIHRPFIVSFLFCFFSHTDGPNHNFVSGLAPCHPLHPSSLL